MAVPGNGHVGLALLPTKKIMGSIGQLKHIYTNAHSLGNKEEGPEAIVQHENYYVVAIIETW